VSRLGSSWKARELGGLLRASASARRPFCCKCLHMAPTPEQLVKHLFYEVWMLGSTLKKLNSRDFPDIKTANALIESFCIHARNLNEFFLENGRDDTLKASSFATSDYKTPENTAERRELFAKINKQISHLTEARATTVEAEKIGTPERNAMYALLYDDLDNFDRHLNPELRPAWKVVFAERLDATDEALS